LIPARIYYTVFKSLTAFRVHYFSKKQAMSGKKQATVVKKNALIELTEDQKQEIRSEL
jgi:hypothetical protein